MENVIFYVLIVALLALVFAYFKTKWILKQPEGNPKMIEISKAIREGANAFLKREYKIIAIVILIVATALTIFNTGPIRLVALSFVIGAVCSGLAGFIGMKVATNSNARTTAAAQKGLNPALKVAFSSGSVMGMCVVGLSLFGLAGLFLIYIKMFGTSHGSLNETVLPILAGFSLGASTIALFARVGGGIFTKAADVGADLVGKVEIGIPEDDPRNPASIADNVGDNVGDVAGMGADLFESYSGAILSSVVLGAVAISTNSLSLSILPLMLASVGIVASIIGTFFVRTKDGGDPQIALDKGMIVAGILFVIFAYPIIKIVSPAAFSLSGHTYTSNGIFFAVLVGLVAGTLIGFITNYYTAEGKKQTIRIAKSAQTGPATAIIEGLGTGMLSVTFPALILALAIILSHKYCGLYGIAIAGLGMLSTTGIQLAVDAYGPVADNAGGIAQMAGLDESVRKKTDKLDAVGNTTAAIGKGFAIGSAALTALALFEAYKSAMGITSVDISNPMVIGGLMVGAMMPFLFSSLAMRAVGEAAFDMVQEVRRQFKTIPGIMEGTGKPDYAKCVDISTASALQKMILPASLGVVTPILVGVLFGKEMLCGLLIGTTMSGVMLALFMANAGGAWDNAKKYIETGKMGGKGSDAHKAAVIGDTVGDPFKDTAGPSLNVLMKLMATVALIMAPMLKLITPLFR